MITLRNYNLWAGALGLLMAGLAAITISNGLHYVPYYDDYYIQVTYQNHGFWGGLLYLFTNCNGRLVSHFLGLCIIPFICGNQLLLTGFYLVNVVLITFSVSWFLKSFFFYRYAVELSNRQAIVFGCLFYCLFYFFFFAKRFDFWYYVGAVFTYEYSLILILILNAILLRKSNTKIWALPIIGISLCLGLMSESNAIGQLVVLCFLVWANKQRLLKTATANKWILISACLIIISLPVNYFAAGNQHKMMMAKTQVSGACTYLRALVFFINDLFTNWGHITVNGLKPYRLNSIYIQLISAALLLVFTTVFATRLKAPTSPGNKHKYVFGIATLAGVVLCITYLVPSLLYVNIFSTIPDRCKLMGCFFVFLTLFDAVVMADFLTLRH